jgi:hypothetical protein
MRTTYRYLAALILAVPALGLTQGAHADRLPGSVWYTNGYYAPYAMPRYYPYRLHPWRFEHRPGHRHRDHDRDDYRQPFARFGNREMPHYSGRRHGDRHHHDRYHDRRHRDRDAYAGHGNDRSPHHGYAKGDRH